MKRIECKPEEATVAVWGSVEYRLLEWGTERRWVAKEESIYSYSPEFMLKRGARFYKEEEPAPCLVRFDDEGREPGLGHYWRKWYWGDFDAFAKAANRSLLVLLLKEGADAQKVYEQVLKVEGVEA